MSGPTSFDEASCISNTGSATSSTSKESTMYSPDIIRAETAYRGEQIARMWRPIRTRRHFRRGRAA